MAAIHLDRLTWAEVKSDIADGRDTVIVPFGSTEQHGRHMPLGTDAVLGDEIGWALADRLESELEDSGLYSKDMHEFVVALTLAQSPDIHPLTVGVTTFIGQYRVEWQYLFASSLIAIVPVVILFIVIEKWLVGGLTAGAVK